MTRLAYTTHGDPTAPSILMLHGFLSSNGQWLLNSAALSASYHLVQVELWGHGDSPQPEAPDGYSVERYVEEFEQIRQEIGIGTWSVIGQSYGAGIVIRYALARPEVVSAVVVTNSRSAFGDVARSPRRKADASRNKQPASLRDLPYHPIHARRFPQHVKDALVAAADRMSMDTVRDSSTLATQLNCQAELHRLAAPILLANGVYEKAFQEELTTLAADAPNLEVVDLQGGHSINIEAADAFNQAALTFLDRHVGRPTA